MSDDNELKSDPMLDDGVLNEFAEAVRAERAYHHRRGGPGCPWCDGWTPEKYAKIYGKDRQRDPG
jgi:hypothetical protein